MMPDIEKLSYWERKTFLDNIDYLVIGAGIVGYSTALHLRWQNPAAKIVILERGFLPSGASSKNAGFACFGSATELYADLQRFDEETVWETVRMRWEGLQYLKEIIGADALKLQTNGSWDLITGNDRELYEKTAEILPYLNGKIESITGEKGVYSIDDNVADKFHFSGVDTSFYNRLEGQIDTGAMNHAFYKKIIASDIHVLFGVEVGATGENGEITSSIGKIKANAIAVCTNGFAQTLLKGEHVLPARAQVLVTKPIKNLKVEGTFHYRMGYYYFRNIDNRILFGGGRNLNPEGETTMEFGLTDEIQSSLENILSTVILPDTSYEIDYKWSGIMGVGEDKKPIIKKIDEKTFCGVKLGGMGVAIGTLVGKKLSELMIEEE